jgi:hypothetical protein
MPAETHRESAPETHLFIAGCPRSGTSALVFLLNEHPNLAIGLERFKRIRAHLDPFHFAPTQFFSPLARETDIRGELLYARLRARWDAGQVTVIGDKVPLYTRILPRLLERFPTARVVVLVREPLDVAISFCKRAHDPEDWWPAENDHRLALEMWNETLASARAAERCGEGERVFLLPYEPLLAGDERWLSALISFIDVPPSERLAAEQQRLAAEWQRRVNGREPDTELAAYVEAHRDPELSAWAHERMERQLERVSTIDPSAPGWATTDDGYGGSSSIVGEPPPTDGAPSPAQDGTTPINEVAEREREREELLRELRGPGRRGADEVDVLERRLIEQAAELARRGERLQSLASAGQSIHMPSNRRSYEGRVTLILPHQRPTTGGVYAIEQFARHLAEHLPVTAVVRNSSTRPIPGVPVRAVAELEAGALPHGDVLLYPADMKDAELIPGLPKSIGRPIALLQGYGTPGSPVVDANLDRAEEAVAIAHWLVDDALRHGTACAYVPYGLDRAVFSPGRPPRERAARVSVMTHHLDWKGHADALEALALVRSARPDVEVVLFGVKPVEGFGRFVASPSRPEVAELLHSSAVHVVASWEEGFGLAGAEAIACGAALASTDTKGSREYAVDECTALVSKPRDPAALADNVLRLLDEVDLRERLVVNGQRHLRWVMPSWSEAGRRLALALFEDLPQLR